MGRYSGLHLDSLGPLKRPSFIESKKGALGAILLNLLILQARK